MAMYPEVQKKAQREIDHVVGSARLPDFGDKNSLPYINTIIKESLRWQNVFPLSIARSSTKDDEYQGYFIPKDTVVIQSTWSIMHDPENYSDPHEFRPERFLKDGQINTSVLDSMAVVFGIGRRICPGMVFADNSLYSILSTALAVFDIYPGVDTKGNPVKINCEMTSGILSYPKPFECAIKPRSSVALSLIKGFHE
ncbi:hypothetical protein M422DRAFT_196300 [Sphaerobolus stellatus SS14]|uniref:Unplaced genomic scaffold SPHSTscaffold_713, whole genome shotgun sequence n=1 Tax=Sphaerobolus stellatus (strain SS14) TaxID=990650 RepID=A0A0C9UCF5_SPHS4|nr:hypothetical protein M422DRAFT_196300 [Sphaerobolus stellatus SS14]